MRRVAHIGIVDRFQGAAPISRRLRRRRCLDHGKRFFEELVVGVAFKGNIDDGASRFDLVAVFQIGFGDLVLIDVSPVPASHVHQTTMRRIHFHQKVKPGEVTVFDREAKVCSLRSADEKRIMTGERINLALMGSIGNRESDSHEASVRFCRDGVATFL
jgi:hypothetical protein